MGVAAFGRKPDNSNTAVCRHAATMSRDFFREANLRFGERQLDCTMKTTLAAKFSLLTILVFIAAFIAGCKTTPPVDWNSRIGTYTYSQAVTELGSPDKRFKLDDDKTLAQWITVFSSALTPRSGYVREGVELGVSQNTGLNYSESVLQLTFDKNGKLVAWSKN